MCARRYAAAVQLPIATGMLLVALAAAAATTPAGCRAHWVGSWSASPSNSSFARLSNQTLRMIVAPHLGGRTLRIRLTNRFGSAPITLDGVRVGLQGAGAALAGPSRTVRFARAQKVTIPAGQEVTSDPVRLRFEPFQNLAISVFVAGVVQSPTEHFNTRQTSYLTPSGAGDHSGDRAATAFTQRTGTTYSAGWYLLAGVDVRARGSVGAVVAFGDSITDGYQGDRNPQVEDLRDIDTNGRYPDGLARRLIAAGRPLSVLNAGISGNRILANGQSPVFGPSGLSRLVEDVVLQPGVTDVIVLEGINDIGITQASADQVIAGLRQIVETLHAAGLRVLLGTLVPAGGTIIPSYGGAGANQVRERVNEWIRGQQLADGVVDFDAATRDPETPSHMRPPYDSSDHLHPSLAGYEAMADAVDLAHLGGNACAVGRRDARAAAR